MSPVTVGLIVQLALTVAAVLSALLPHPRLRSVVTGTTAGLLGLSGVVTGLMALLGGRGQLELPVALPVNLPLDTLVLSPDALGGIFMAVAGGVGALAAVYGIGYAHGAASSRTGWTAFVVFLLGMQMVPAAADSVSFLLAWEVMALASSVLLLSDHTVRPQVRSAAVWYAGMTHLSFVFLLAGFAVLASSAGGTSFAGIAPTSSAAEVGAFVLLVLGFSTKAGLVPMHVWLPRAHPEAPSHVSAAMSAAMVKMGVYGVLLVVVRLLPAGPRWWAVLLLVLGGVSALFGILQASVTSDLKRLLAYSTTENVGLMVTAIAVAMLLRDAGQPLVADVAWVAALLLVVSHAAFKAVLFMGAGAVLHGTGERDLDRMGGLGRSMPTTSVVFAVAAAGAAALPVSSGFVAEWTLLQSLIHGDGQADRVVAVALPVTVAVVALTVGLALLTFVKAYGIAFLARPRSDGAAHAQEASISMRTAMAAGALVVIALGLAPGPLASALGIAVGAQGIDIAGLLGLDLPAAEALLNPVALLLLAAAVAVPVIIIQAVMAYHRPRRNVDLAWGCGGERLSPRMQYTATSYAEPLVRVFDDALQPSRDLTVSHADESSYLAQRVEFRQQLVDVVEERAYAPAVAGAARLGTIVRRIQNGSIHRYLAFSFAALLVVLVAVTW